MRLLIAIYRVVLTLREERELVALAAAKIGMGLVLRTTAVFALLCGVFTLWVSGNLEPQARFAQRLMVFDFKHQALSGGIAAGEFHAFNDYTIFARSREGGGELHRVFVLDESPAETSRVITANRSALVGPDADGFYSFRLQRFSVHEVPDKPRDGEPHAAHGGRLVGLHADRYDHDLSLGEFLRFRPRAEVAAEWTLAELLGLSAPPGPLGAREPSEAALRMVRAALCLAAPALAVIALALTRPQTRSLTLRSLARFCCRQTSAPRFSYRPPDR